MQNKLILNVTPNAGYAADQVNGLTLAELRDLIADAIDEYGEDAELVTYDGGNRYGAKFGTISTDPIEDADADADADRDNY